jgi:preprotein translocase subunit SecG
MGVILFLHVVICILLIGIILIQAGRGGGLVESFSSVESMFGTKTNAFLTRATAVLSTLFFITCLTLALLSAKQGRSLLRDVKTMAEPTVANETQTTPETSAPAETLPDTPSQGVAAQNVSTSEAPKPE